MEEENAIARHPVGYEVAHRHWEVDLAGWVGRLKAQATSATPATNVYKGTLQLDGFPPEAVDVTIADCKIEFFRPGASQQYEGFIQGDRILGVWTDTTGMLHSWRARETELTEGLVEIGDLNQDGQTDNRDIVKLITNQTITLNTYRICDNRYNPACFELLRPAMPSDPDGIKSETFTWRPDGEAKTIAPDRFDEYTVPAIGYPPEKIPNIRSLGKILNSLSAELKQALYHDRGWTMDFSGFIGDDKVTGMWDIEAHGWHGFLFVCSLAEGCGRVKFDLIGHWEAVYDVKVHDYKLTFRRTLPIGVDQLYAGTISGRPTAGLYGNKVEGTFTQEGQEYAWSGSGLIRTWDHTTTLAINANGWVGTLKLRVGGNGWLGRVYFAPAANTEPPIWDHPERWEEIEHIEFSGDKLCFRRPKADQDFEGTISGDTISGTFTGASGASHSWSGTRVRNSGGTSLEGTSSIPQSEIGTLSKQIRYFTYSTPLHLVEEAIGHPLKGLILNAQSPFTAADKAAYDEVGFQSAPGEQTWSGRPVGFVSRYAAGIGEGGAFDADSSEDLANTINAYVVDRASLWTYAHEDIGQYNSSLLWKKMEFLREHVFHDAKLENEWRLNANGVMGKLKISLLPSSPPHIDATIRWDGSSSEYTVIRFDFNGLTAAFDGKSSGGSDQNYIGELKGNKMEGIFRQGSQTYTWSATV